MIEKLNYFFTNYKVERKRLDKVSVKDSIINVLNTLLINFILFLIPVLIVYNLFIFDNLYLFLHFIIIFLIICFSFSYNFFYILITKNNYENLQAFSFKRLIIIESTIQSLLLIFLAVIIMQIVR